MNRSSTCHACCGGGGAIAAIALATWFGLPIILSALTRIGLGFARADPVLVPLMVVAMGTVLFGLWLGLRSHGRAEPLMVGVVGSIATLLGVVAYAPVAVFGFLIVIGAIGANQLFMRHSTTSGVAS